MSGARPARAIGRGVLCVALLAVALEAAGSAPVGDRFIPDLDAPGAAVLDLATGELAPAPGTASFAEVEAYQAALAKLGDLAYEDAKGGMLFVASGFALPLGAEAPEVGALRGLDGKLEARSFLRRSELDAGHWFALRTRSGELSIARVVSRSDAAIRLGWLPPQPPDGAFEREGVERIAALRPASVEKGVLPVLGTTPEAVLRLVDGTLSAGPALPESFSAPELNALVEAVGRVGDLAYFRPRAGRLVVPGGMVAGVCLRPGCVSSFSSCAIEPATKC